jgi:hypothetical protein
MIIKKKGSNTWNVYEIELSFGELMAFYEMTKKSNGAIADEMRANLSFYMTRLPEPGVDEKDLKKEQEAKKEAEKGESDEGDLPPADSELTDIEIAASAPKASGPAQPEILDDLPSPTEG